MATLILDAFGQLSLGTGVIDSKEEDLYSVFHSRGELMRWLTTPDRPHRLLWGMNEAELTAETDESRIGFVQVALDVGEPERVEVVPPAPGYTGYAPLGVRYRSVEPALVLPALVQCFDDSLRRFGDIEMDGLQVTAYGLGSSAQSHAFDLVSALNWFNLIPKGKTEAIIAFDQEMLGGQTEAELTARLRLRGAPFEFGPVVPVPERHAVKTSFAWTPPISPARSGLGMSVSLPEWTASAIAWVLAAVIDGARTIAPDVSRFAVRVTRVG